MRAVADPWRTTTEGEAMRRIQLAAALAVTALTGCGDDPETFVPNPNDTTKPSQVVMDAHYVDRSGNGQLRTVTAGAPGMTVTLDNLPAFTFIARGDDEGSGIPSIAILGETDVDCVGVLGQNKHGSWLQRSPAGAEPASSRITSLVVKLGRQSPSEPYWEYIARCPQGMTLRSVSGSFWAEATNGVGLSDRTSEFRFSWTRPS
jgi:hypothetical protein